MSYHLLRYYLLSLFSVSLFLFSASAQDDSSKKVLPANVLYIIDGKVSSKEQAEKLNTDMIKSVDVLKGDSAVTRYGTKGANGVVVITTKTSVIPLDADSVFTNVQNVAAFPGGIDGWRKYLEANLHYPKAAQKRGTQGLVRVQMTVKKDGSVTDLAVLNDPGDGLGDEGKRVIQKGPKWIPATRNGRAVNYEFTQTITFVLQ